MKKRITAAVLIICCLLSLCSCSSEPTIEKSSSIYDVTRYVLDITNIDFTPYIVGAEMEVEKDIGYEFAYIKLHLNYKYAADVTKILKMETNVDDSPTVRIPSFKNHQYTKELVAMEFTGHYMYVKTGGSLTEVRKVDIYTGFVGEGNGKEYYVYLFG